ncbi:gastrula zinc finger protein XlCGF66.1-like isoform X2 [Engystomops pustulosus]|uniref:gastrula zinc finger protein XlCGF66.1-like isoform X2 n=1 Tax=Engystomops pustulosus TaxID=76066 RepID=UPI003AFAEAEF
MIRRCAQGSEDSVVPRPYNHGKGRSKMTENILHLTLEIIRLLTGEDFMVVQKSPAEAPSRQRRMSDVRHRSRRPCMESTSHSLIERDNLQKVLSLTNRMLEVLTGEVPVRCQDVAVYFSMEEWEYIEEHKDLYKDFMLEDHQTLTSQDESWETNIPGISTPLCLQNSPEEIPSFPQDNQTEDLMNIKVEVIKEEEMYIKGNEQFQEEDSRVDGPADDGTTGGLPSPPYSEAGPKDIPHYMSSENSIAPNLRLLYNKDLPPEPPNQQEPSLNPSQTQGTDRREAKLFPCSECGRHYKTVSNLSMHMRMHRNERPFACSQCGKCFTKKSILIDHQKVHTGEKPFSCNECGKSFTKKSAVVEHRRSHTGERPFSCLECGKRFARKSVLAEHQRIHTGKKPFSCPECRKCFMAKHHLERHQITHTGEKPFSCSECGRSFTRKWLLERHLRTHME